MADPLIRFNLRQLGVFKSVAECGGIREAARRLGLTQPAVTHAMRELEQGLGVDLFVRSVKGVTLTTPGEALLLRARRMLHEAQNTQSEIEQMSGGQGGRLRIALSAAAASTVLPHALIDFRAQRPRVTLELREMTWPTRLDGWKEGEYDFAVLAEADIPRQDRLERELLLTVPAVLAARVGHPLAGARSILELAGALWLAPGYGMDALNMLFEQREQPPPQDIIYCHSVSIALSLVRNTDAIGLVSSRMFCDESASRGLVVLDVAEAFPPARISIVIRHRQTLTPAANLFIECLRRSAAQVL